MAAIKTIKKEKDHGDGGVYGCIFSANKKHRFALWRIWDEKLPVVQFIGLNPSTADEKTDDPTIRRVKQFAADHGYGGAYMTNLYPFITPFPKELWKASMGVATLTNDSWLETIREICKDVLFAWGNFDIPKERTDYIIKTFPGALCLGYNKNGSPKHPLYISSKQKMIIYEP